TRAVADLADHPFPALRNAGVVVTLNTDDPGMFDTTLNNEYGIAQAVFGLADEELAELARTAARVSYAPEAVRRRLLAEIDAYAEGFDPA
ncbi:MAG: adenosine deaminase, partial [Nocardioidaceae bacterium]